jgi:hypothetical protein
MGMFDSLHVSHALIRKAIEEANADVLFDEFDEFDGYCIFQTKDLDNSLTNFYIREDGFFCWEKQEYIHEEINRPWSPLKPIGAPEYVADPRTTYIDFYDFYQTDTERVFVTFTAHVKKGKLVEPIAIKSVEKTNLEEEAIQHKKSREEWNKVTSTWQWKLATFIHDWRFRVQRSLYSLTNKFDLLDSYLRKQAKKGTSLK